MSGPSRGPRSSTASSAIGQPIAPRTRSQRRGSGAASLPAALPRWWPLAAVLILAAALRLSTLSLQSLWYDEAYTPVHVLHPSLIATLRSVSADENTPPLWYVLVWGISRVLGTGVVALRLLSALAGIAIVGVGWAIGAALESRRTALLLAAILALNPLFVWYSQEARAYELYALVSAVSLLFFVRAYRSPTPGLLAAWAASSALALLTHYFAVFLVVPQVLLLLGALLPQRGARARRPTPTEPDAHPPRAARATLTAVTAVAACAAALVPLVIAQGGHGTQWIGKWGLVSRLEQIPGYYLLGANGSVLGHGLLALSALPLAGAIVLLGILVRRARLVGVQLEAITLMLGLGLVAIAVPLALALVGIDYLAPRNLIADWVPLSAALALVCAGAERIGTVLAVVVCVCGAAVVIATDLDPRLQRGDWSAVAASLRPAPSDRVIVTVEDGAAPLEYYLPKLRLRYLSRKLGTSVREVDLVGYAPLRTGALRPPTRAFRLIAHTDVYGLLAYRYAAATPQRLGGRFLRRLTITAGDEATSEVLLPSAIAATHG